jgi:phage tail sheath protein FI
VFQPNTQVTRNKFLNQVNPYLESVQQKQGLFAFEVIMDDTNNTPDLIDRGMLVGAINIQPTIAAEVISLTFNILPTGTTFNV